MQTLTVRDLNLAGYLVCRGAQLLKCEAVASKIAIWHFDDNDATRSLVDEFDLGQHEGALVAAFIASRSRLLEMARRVLDDKRASRGSEDTRERFTTTRR